MPPHLGKILNTRLKGYKILHSNYFYLSPVVDEDIGALDVPVEEVVLVAVGKALQQLPHDARVQLRREGCKACERMLHLELSTNEETIPKK